MEVISTTYRTRRRCISWPERQRNIIQGRWDKVHRKIRKILGGSYFTCLYVIQEEMDGFVKIGTSRLGCYHRMGELNIGNPRELVPVYSVIGVFKTYENELHKKFEKYHKRGEWYDKDILEDHSFINELLSFDSKKSPVIIHSNYSQ